jgi:RNA polymerase sigma factor (TIGR02999 family)
MSDETTPGMVTQMLKAVGQGDPRASAELLPVVYAELRKLAQARMARTPPGNTLQPTALVHEAYLRLVGADDPSWQNRGHFFASAAEAMKQILVDQARRKNAIKRGGDRQREEMGDEMLAIETPFEDVLALSEAIDQLEREDARKAAIVKLKFFAGLTNEETAAVLEISVPTVEREWRFVRALLYSQLAGDTNSGER